MRSDLARRWLGPGVFLLVLVLDFLTKQWALAALTDQGVVQVTGFFNLVLVWNRGVSFGMFQAGSEQGRWLLVGMALVVSIVLVFWLRRERRPLPRLAIWLILAGALGNVVDRVRYGAVVDFLDFHAFGYHWPAFNVADSAIVVGAALLVGDSLLGSREALPVAGRQK
ncbi:MAG: signal peptidase II [Geminicoccaceae bacterium]